MERDKHMPGDTQSSHDDLYVQDLPASLTQRISSVIINDQPDDDTSAISPTANAQGGENEEPPIRSESPSFERPAAWRAIDVAHFERLANERAAEAERAQSSRITNIEASLHSRQAIIDRAIQGLFDFDEDWAVPPPWSHNRFQGDLSQHPYLLERYANQEMEIRGLVNKRIKLLVSHMGVESVFKPSNEWKRFTEAVKSRSMEIELDELDLHIRSLLAFKLDSLMLSVEKGEVKPPDSRIVSELPPKLLDATIQNEQLYERFRKLWEYEKENFPHLFLEREFPSFLHPWERSRAAASPPAPEPLNPPESLLETLNEARNMLRTDSWLSQSGDSFFNQKPSITEQWIPFETREQISQWPELKQQLKRLRDRELELFPGRFPSILVGEDGSASSTEEASNSSRHASTSRKRMDDSTLFEGTSQNYTSNPSSISQPFRYSDRTSPKLPSETLSLSSRPQSGPTGSSIQLSMQAPEAESTSSPFLSMPTSSVQRSSDVPTTPIRSPALSPPPVLTPVPSQADSSAPKASPIPASRLKYRLEVERRRSDDGTVLQMRFGGEDILPVETPGESSTSRVYNWLDGSEIVGGTIIQEADAMIEHVINPEVESSPERRSDRQPEQELDQQSEPKPDQQSEQELDQRSGQESDERPDPEPDQQLEQDRERLDRVASDTAITELRNYQEFMRRNVADWDSLTEEEKQRRRDSAYKSRQGSLADPPDGRK